VKGDGPMQKQRRWFKQFYSIPIQLEYEDEKTKTAKEKEHEQRADKSTSKFSNSMEENNIHISDSF
jgi:hypothetical protein